MPKRNRNQYSDLFSSDSYHGKNEINTPDFKEDAFPHKKIKQESLSPRSLTKENDGMNLKNVSNIKNKHIKTEGKIQKENYSKEHCNEVKSSDVELQECVIYYENLLRTLKHGQTSNSIDRDTFIISALQESVQKEVELCCRCTSSHCIELLLSECQDESIFKRFMRAFAQKKNEVFSNANASHIMELLIHFAFKNIKIPVVSNEDTEETKLVSYSEDWLCDFGLFVVEKFLICLDRSYTCHILCTMIQALGGDLSRCTEFQSKKSEIHKKNFHQEYLGKTVFGTEERNSVYILDQIPESFAKILKEIAKCIKKLDNVLDYATDSSAGVVIEALLFILKKRLPKRCKKLVYVLMMKICSEKNEECIPYALLHKNCSYVIENLLMAADEDIQLMFWNEYVANFLEQLIAHPVGNYLLQKLFNATVSKSQFETMCEATGKLFEDILKSGHYGIFVSIATACNRLKAQQAQFMKNIMQCLHCIEPEERQAALVPLLIGFQTYDKYAAKDTNMVMCLQGSLLVQAILNFQKPIKAVKSILNMKPNQLEFLACHVQSCHILHSFFHSTSVGEKNKDKLIYLLKPIAATLASDREGSLTLSRIWTLLSIKQKSVIAEELAKNEQILQSSRNGSIILKKFAIFRYKHHYDKWKEIQNNLLKSRNIKNTANV